MARKCGYFSESKLSPTSSPSNVFKLSSSNITRIRRLNGDDLLDVVCDIDDNNTEILSNIDRRDNLYTFNPNEEDDEYVVDHHTKVMVNSNRPKYRIQAVSRHNDIMRNDMVYGLQEGSQTFFNRIEFLRKYSTLFIQVDPDVYDLNLYATVFENFGLTNLVSCLDRVCKYYNLEYHIATEFDGSRYIEITRQVGVDAQEYVELGVNMKELSVTTNSASFATYGRGFGAWKDDDDPSKGRLESFYRSPLADRYGVIPIEPVVDERFSVLDNLTDEIKKRVNSSYVKSFESTLDDAFFTNTNIELSCGDTILIHDKSDKSLRMSVRIFEIEETFTDRGDLILKKYTLGDYSSRYKELMINNDIKVFYNKLHSMGVS